MTEQSAKQRRPFHESIVEAIRCASYSDMMCLGMLINETKIPKGHDEILAAWQERVLGPWDGHLVVGLGDLESLQTLNIPVGLLEEKQEAEKKEEEKKAKEQVETATS
ncbi:MAG: hypothetical protein G01um10142_150 [Parcubacteria group bacterium Gr01-1014_2]|nr:MAG: hypothetical protein G01um10142_150 [Parcubacteria group bacterium Gr01-1014_2]